VDALNLDSELLLAAMPALENKTPPWPMEKGDETQYRFHSSILVINSRNWKEHFAKQENMPWQKIASMHDELKFVGHDQPVLQYAAQGKYLHLPEDFVNFATKYTQTTRVVTSGVWRKPWTVPRDQYFKYICSLMMYQSFEQVFGVIKELDIYSQYENDMFEYLNCDSKLKQDVLLVKNNSLIKSKIREIAFLKLFSHNESSACSGGVGNFPQESVFTLLSLLCCARLAKFANFLEEICIDSASLFVASNHFGKVEHPLWHPRG
jgi:lipopolysaccharide biosynthesis glycosyltransferase